MLNAQTKDNKKGGSPDQEQNRQAQAKKDVLSVDKINDSKKDEICQILFKGIKPLTIITACNCVINGFFQKKYTETETAITLEALINHSDKYLKDINETIEKERCSNETKKD